MSSLAAARADNFYIDPSRFDPSKKGRGSANALANSHPLGERAKRLYTEGILVVRFEMPHDCWCLKCNQHIARGIRFNADKKSVGSYFTTKIWEFEMTCTFGCGQKFVIRTDPKNAEYEYVSGARRKVREYDPAEAGAVTALPDAAKQAIAGGNTFFKLEHEADDLRAAKRIHAELAALAETQANRYSDDYASNRAARDAARAARAESAAAFAEGAARGLTMPLLPASDADAMGAKLMMRARDRAIESEGEAGVKRRRVEEAESRVELQHSSTVLHGFVRAAVQTHRGAGVTMPMPAPGASNAPSSASAPALSLSSLAAAPTQSKQGHDGAAPILTKKEALVSRQARSALLAAPMFGSATHYSSVSSTVPAAGASSSAIDVSRLKLKPEPMLTNVSALPSFDSVGPPRGIKQAVLKNGTAFNTTGYHVGISTRHGQVAPSSGSGSSSGPGFVLPIAVKPATSRPR